MGFFKEVLGSGKDLALSKAARKLSERYVSRFGRIVRMDIDSAKRSMEVEVILKGESEPITVMVNQYEIVFRDGRYMVILNDIHASREWIELLARDYLVGRSIELPSYVAQALTYMA